MSSVGIASITKRKSYLKVSKVRKKVPVSSDTHFVYTRGRGNVVCCFVEFFYARGCDALFGETRWVLWIWSRGTSQDRLSEIIGERVCRWWVSGKIGCRCDDVNMIMQFTREGVGHRTDYALRSGWVAINMILCVEHTFCLSDRNRECKPDTTSWLADDSFWRDFMILDPVFDDLNRRRVRSNKCFGFSWRQMVPVSIRRSVSFSQCVREKANTYFVFFGLLVSIKTVIKSSVPFGFKAIRTVKVKLAGAWDSYPHPRGIFTHECFLTMVPYLPRGVAAQSCKILRITANSQGIRG